MKEKKILEREKTHLVAEAEKLSKLLADAEADWVALDQARLNLAKDKEMLAQKKKEMLESLASLKTKKNDL